ncbi:cysteine proteinase [Fragilariopsis cylindrus CCMP1102]|uniref:Cysteine proteinase n=1 Tax=Fragilariopsis cylindrus CCMP1102 TaxID=635003 RepID=A0A1E7EQ78_9STRA|nr:cysteine proteinase [Fragilariopsis cylindrus CCMP1102]|eukprot:OEU08014.1 cysteine proteinase [Fragilariopsis cylindrus CCMP1102]
MLFDKFMIQFNKSYPTNDEKEYRMKIFQDNMNKIDLHNNNGTTKFKLGINQFTDMTHDEIPKGFNKGQVYGKTAHNQFKETTSHLFSNVRDGTTSTATASVVSSGDGNNGRKLRASVLPKSVDWRTVKTTTGSPVTTPVKDQGRCGSCWAFAATSVLESHIALATNTLFSLSPQEFVSCTLNPNNCGGTGGCTGSTGEIAFDYVAKHGVVTEWKNGYTSYNGNSGTCTLNDDDDDDDDDKKSSSPTGTNDGYLVGAVASIVGFSSLPSNSYDSLMYTIAMIGPVVVSVAANHWGMYQSGIFDDSDRNSYGDHYDINHAVVLEGYGTDEVTDDDYWLVRNSWGAAWGENGYIRLKRNDPSTLEDPMSICKTDNSPTHGVACTGPDQDITPPVELTCGTSGILYANVIPIGAHLL